ncbi:MAG: hypothetical protein OHK0053_30690 [Microscillaceae bacterium]
MLLAGAIIGAQPGYGQITTYTNADRIRMQKEAESLINQYEFNLNQIGAARNSLREDDINLTLSNVMASSDVLIYNDLVRQRRDSGSSFQEARAYLENIHPLYPSGVKFEYSINLKNPCYLRQGTETFYYVKAEVFKNLQGILATDDAMHINNDSIDIYIKFPILQNRPNLITGPARIYQITPHVETQCVEIINEDNRVKLADDEREFVVNRAEIFVADYVQTLNIIGNPRINNRYTTEDYFLNKSVPVYNDLVPIIRLRQFVADEYLQYIELWYQEGIEFDYRTIKATNVLLEPDFVSVEVEVDRIIKVPDKNFRDRQGIKIYVRFPFLEDGRVGAERSTPRIYKIEAIDRKYNDRNYLAVGGQINAIQYFGELNPINSRFRPTWSLTRPSLAIHAVKKLNPFLYVRASLSMGRVFGDDFTAADPKDPLARYRYIRNLHFRNFITELSAVAIVDLRPNTGLYYRRKFITPYLFGGIGLISHNPQARGPGAFRGNWIDLQPLGTEGQGQPGYEAPYKLIQPVIPFGLGVKFRLGYRWDMAFEAGMRYTFFDHLDDVSGDYPDPGDLRDAGDSQPLIYRLSNRSLESEAAFRGLDRTDLDLLINQLPPGVIDFVGSDGRTYSTFNGYGRRGEQRGNPRTNDIYVLTGFHLTYLLRVNRPTAPIQIPDYEYNF